MPAGYSSTITGTTSADTLAGTTGNDTIDGGAGFDTVVFTGNYASYILTPLATGLIVSGADGRDVLAGIERLQFADVAINVTINGAAETRVNTYTASEQFYPSSTALANGGWVVTWMSLGQDGSGWGVYGQRYGADGAMRGTEFQVNTYTNSDQREPSVTALADGGWVVVWMSAEQDGSSWGIYGQRFGGNGVPQGSEFAANAYTNWEQRNPSVTALSNGGWVVTWMSLGQDGSEWGVYGQRYGANGATQGAEFRANTDTTFDQYAPSVTALADGGWVVTWQSDSQERFLTDIYGQRFGADGARLGAEFKVNTYTTDSQYDPCVTALTDGGWVVAWTSAGQDGSSWGIFGQRFGVDGTIQGSEFRVNTYTNSEQWEPSIAALTDGGWVVTWMSNGQDGSAYGVYGQRYGADGAMKGAEFQANTYTTAEQTSPSVTALADGGWVLTWMSNGQDGSVYGLYTQRYTAEGLAYGNATFEFAGSTPSITSNGAGATALISISENSAAITTVTATDPDAGTTLTYSISGGADSALFQINASTGALSFKAPPNFEAPSDAGGNNVYDVIVQASDAALTDTQAIAVTVTDMDEIAPTVLAFSPTDGLVDVALGANIVLSFSETIARGTGVIQIRAGSATGTVVETFDAANSARLTMSGSTLTIDPTYGLASGTQYFVTFAAGSVKDLAGNSFAGLNAYSFTTDGSADISLIGTDGDDTLLGTISDDIMSGGLGNDTLAAGAGNDLLDGGAGNDIMIGGAGNDVFVMDSLSDLVIEIAGEGTDEVRVAVATAGGTYKLAGNVENATLTNTVAFNLTGNGLGNILTGNDAANVLNGGAGADTLIGGGGNDTYVVDNSGDVVTEALNAGSDLVQVNIAKAGGTYTAGNNIENLTLTNTVAFNLVGNNLANRLTGNAADNVLNGGAGNDTLIGGAGNDTYVIDSLSDVVTETVGNGIDLVQVAVAAAGGTYTLAANVENATLTNTVAFSLTGTADDNVLVGNGAVNTLNGGLGNDTLDGGAGNDTLIGGAGNDTYVIDGLSDVVTEAVDIGIDLVQVAVATAGGTYTVGANVENATLINTVAFNLTGNLAANVLTGNDAANILDGGAGNDTLIGGAGNDTYVIDSLSDVVTEATNGGTDLVQVAVAVAGGTYTVAANVENASLTNTVAFNLTGNGLGNVLTGNNAANTLDGGAGDDTMVGGGGNDTYIVDSVGDVTTEAANGGNDLVQVAVAASGLTYALGANIENATLINTVAFNLTGNASDNVLTGNDSANTLDGGLGNDTLIGGGGNDTYVVDSVSDLVVEAVNGGTDLVQVAINTANLTYALGANIENATLINAVDFNLTGNASDNRLTGNDAANTLDGGLGNDTLIGGWGNDTYVVESVGDVIIEAPFAGTDTVRVAINTAGGSYTAADNVENLALISTVAFNLIGNSISNVLTGNDADNVLEGGASADTLIGNGGNDTLNGGTGSDTMSGGTGNDTYYVDSAADLVLEGTNNGIDTVIVDMTNMPSFGTAYNSVRGFAFNYPDNAPYYVMSDNVENYKNVADGGYIYGNSQDNYFTFTGNSAVFHGLAGNDTIDASGWTGGNVWAGYTTAPSGINADLTTGKVADGYGTTDTLLSVNAIAGSFFDDRIIGNQADLNLFMPMGGNDYVDGNGGKRDVVWYAYSPAGVTYDAASGIITNDGYGNTDRLLNITEIRGSTFADTISFVSSSVGVTANLAYANGINFLYFENLTGSSFDDALTGGAWDNLIDGGAGNDTLIGGDGNDTLVGGAGNDNLDGGGGTDTATYQAATSAITLSLAITTAQVTGGAGTDTLTGIENLIGGSGNDKLTGDSGVNSLVGGSGDDVLTGGGETDRLDGGDGSDIYLIAAASEHSAAEITDTGSSGTDELRFSASLASTLTLLAADTGLERVVIGTGTDAAAVVTATTAINVDASAVANGLSITGNAGANTLTGTALDDTLNGGAGADSLIGGGGNDTYVIDNTGDTITELGNGGTDLVQVAITVVGSTYALGANLENAIIINTTASNLTGNSADNTLTGNNAANILDGGAGNDTLIGGAGNDTYIVDSAADVITEASNGGTDLVQIGITVAGGSYTLADNVENASLTTNVSVNITGNDLANRLTGNDADNSLDGRGGNDTLIGGAGNDTYVIDSTGDVITEAATSGTDTVQVAIATVGGTYTVAANIENATLVNSVAFNLTGNAADNVLTGNEADNVLNGGLGNDTLIGGAGNDTASYAGAGSAVTVTLAAPSLSAANIINSATQFYNAANGHIYETVNTVMSWTDAKAAAESKSLGGFTGYLVTVTSQAEQDFVTSLCVGRISVGYDNRTIWIGASDADIEGNWTWVTGPEAGTLFWVGAGPLGVYGPTGHAVDGQYSNWRAGGYDAPNVVAGDGQLPNADYGSILLNRGGDWEDDVNSYTPYGVSRPGGNSYVIEYGGANMTANGLGTASGGGGNDTLTGIENLIGSAYDDTLTGDANANILTGGAGNDTLNGGGGSDTLIGGTGDDTYVIDALGDLVTEGTGGGTDNLQVGIAVAGGTYTLSANVENATLTSTIAFNLTGNSGANILTGNDASNILDGGAGNDTLIGGKGDDTYIVDSLSDTVTEAASGGSDLAQVAIATAGGTYAMTDNVENATLINTVAFNLTGNSLDNTLTGNEADNVLNGGLGNDTLIGGAGNDTASYAGAGSAVTVSLAAPSLSAANITNSATQLYNAANGHIYETVNSVLSWTDAKAAAESKSLGGFTGYLVTITSQAEQDFVTSLCVGRISVGYDNRSIWTGASDAAVEGNWTWVTGPEAGTLFWVGAGPRGWYGPAGHAVNGQYSYWRVAYDGPNDVAGDGQLLNADYGTLLLNPTGEWRADVNSYTPYGAGRPGGNAYVIEYGGANMTANGLGTASGGGGNDTLTGIENLIGSAYDDTLTGDANANILTGGDGNDTLVGGAGSDTAAYDLATSAVVVNLATTTAQATGGAGNDTLSGIENLTGSAFSDTLTGDSGANILSGLAGNDTLVGADGNDTLIGGAGNDTLTGGNGADSFVFNFAPNNTTNKDTITDFTSGTDSLQLSKAVFTALTGQVGTLSSEQFWSAAGAVKGHDGDDRIVYNSTTGVLYYDADGSGAGAAVQIALLGTSTHPSLLYTDLQIIA